MYGTKQEQNNILF